ncbi:DUF2286 domain-containing protein [Pyrobaculum aerophilum]|uniref:DUF2286 domain-containing protein n=2 Tax=Pyrobaculum aerophilum TaxID=13773 RepID=Q8ZVQ1_PYRAE|nr:MULTISPECIES: DUF2286 domain-containing protein [Pyrobaculum]AAL64005.1 conserved hypothetical protein [Pyrobaculum aerophilum str. IM2]MCX8136399.1 DUF2286 domain-containing protein [Pyrobaculum aerophilum]HII47228.1 DUF2286 domain-containing protein [Pyrobaculum aerophilum]
MSVVAHISKNTITKKEVINKDVVEAVKEVAIELLKAWDPTASDFIVLRDFYSISYPAPLSRELLEKVRKYSPKRVENRVEIALPVYEIVHSAQWSVEGIDVGDAVVIFPYIDEATTEEILRGVIQSFTSPKEEGDLE